MKITLQKTMPNGALATGHTLDSLTIKADSVLAIVISYTSSGSVCWSESMTIDYSNFVTGDPLQAAASYLTATGRYLAGGAVNVEPTELEALRSALLKKVESIRDDMIAGGVDTPAGRVDTDEISIRNILGSVQTATLSLMSAKPLSIGWRLSDNSFVQLDQNQLVQMGVAVMEHIKVCYTRSWELKALIASAATLQDLQDIPLNQGWVIHRVEQGTDV